MRIWRFAWLSIFGAATIAFSGPALAAAAYKFSILHSFCSMRRCKDGYGAVGLLLDSSGNLYGTSAGDTTRFGGGAIWELVGGQKFKVLYRFCPDRDCSGGASPYGPLIADVNGNLYGTTTAGGASDGGTAFELSPNGGTWTLHTLYSFCAKAGCADGEYPYALTYAGAAKGILYDGVSPLFGTTGGGGGGNLGTVFQITPGQPNWSETVLYNFCIEGWMTCTDGAYPNGVLVDPAGNLFGTANQGDTNRHKDGEAGAGTLFEMTRSGGTWTYTVLYDFCAEKDCRDGYGPGAELIEDAKGNLYGTTVQGGQACRTSGLLTGTCGVVYMLVPNGAESRETVLYRFCAKADCRDGAYPGALIMDSSGSLFGTTAYGGGNDEEQGHDGGGTLFNLSGSTLSTLHRFCADGSDWCTDGLDPWPPIVMNASGALFGTTQGGGADAVGEAYRLKPTR